MSNEQVPNTVENEPKASDQLNVDGPEILYSSGEQVENEPKAADELNDQELKQG